ncbi:type VI secretion system Vgr family protein [Comamonas composti]|uniref:type VI secretion system Vgr family protein n=1 Tax=Comamonas composti TaxID=408558 RepID=UPI000418F4FD|nr:type VI secretion system Vgr family protein [Comamonas composti]
MLQSNRTLSLHCPTIPAQLTVQRVQGQEAINQLFEYRIDLAAPDALNFNPDIAAGYELDDWIGTEASLRMELEGGGTRYLSGLVREARFLHEDGRSAIYQITIVAWLHLCGLRSDCKVFQNQSVVQILDAVLAPYGFAMDKRLIESYPERDYQVQYNETDLAFVQRLCEEWGISYFFEHEEGLHRLVLADHNSAYAPNPGAAYQNVRFAPLGRKLDEEYLHAFAHGQRLSSGAVAMRDYDYTRPKASLEVKHKGPRNTAQADGEIYLWKHRAGGDYSQPNAGSKQGANQTEPQGEMLARMRMQALRQTGDRSAGQGNLRGMQAGHTFTLSEHPRAQSNIEHLIVATELLMEDVGENSQTSTGLGLDRGQHWQVLVKLETQPASAVLRPPITRHKPRCTGPETALVVGPSESQADNNIYTDDQGRIKIQLPWDRYGENNQHSSCWVRVSQAWAGNQLGAMHVPRIGQEVLIDFIAGDPDQPICSGRLNNQLNQPPWKLPEQKALSGIRSRELKPGAGNSAGGRSNHLVLDDSEGKIQAQLQSDHDSSSLSLGHITRIEDNAGRKDYRGEGFELRTDGHGVARAAKGLVISTETRSKAQGHVTDIREAEERLKQAADLHESLAELAQQHKAQEQEPKQQQALVSAELQMQHTQIQGEPQSAGSDDSPSFPELQAPHLVLSSPAGIEATTEQSAHIAANAHVAITSGQHTTLAVGRGLFAAVKDRISLFVHQAGMKLIAASGKVEIQAQSDNVEIVAKKVVELLSTQDWVQVMGKKGVLINGGGSYIKLTGDGIEEGTTGSWVAHAASHSMVGPKSLPVLQASFPEGVCIPCLLNAARHGSALTRF